MAQKKKSAVKAKESEKENKLACSEDEGKQSENEDGGEGHDDAAQDVKLIKKMVGEYLGDGAKDMSSEEMEALHDLGKEAYMAHKEMGAKEDEAYQHAGNALKLAHHMSKKKSEKHESEDGEGDVPPKKKLDPKADKKPAPKDVPDDDEDGAAGEAESEESENHEDESESMESNRVTEYKKKLLKAEGRIAALEAKTKREELNQTIDKTLKESGQPNSVTKSFREAAGEIKSKAEFESLWKIFLEGAKNVRTHVDFGVLMEKSFSREDGGKKSSNSLDFSKCAE